jgi:signal transduction histidine kinase
LFGQVLVNADEPSMLFRQNILRSKSSIVAASVLSVLFLGVADYLTGIEISLAIFYLLSISFVTWFAGRREGVLISVLATTVSFASDFLFAGKYYSHPAVPYWNGVMRGVVFVIVVLLLSRLKVALLHEKETSRVKSDMLSLVGHLNLAMTSNLDLHSVGKSLLETIEVFFPECATTIRLLNRENGDLEPLASGSLDEQEWKSEAPNWPASPEILDEMKAPRIVRNVQTEPRTWNTEFCRKNGLVSYLGLPLIARGDFLGVISLYTKQEHEFTREEISFFTTLAGQSAIALQNARLFEEVRTGHAQLRDLSRRLLDVQETDRRHIARELHDEIGQTLTGLQLTLEMISRLPSQEASSRLDKAQLLINDLIRRVRGLSLNLRPSMLDDLGLLPALIWHIERYTSSTGVEVKFNHNGLEGKRFTPRLETSAYRIVQEALTNIARHTGVKQAMVHAWCMPDTLILEIQDEGAGFDVEKAIRTGKANGLTGMRERTMLLGGKLSIESTPGAGTCVIAELPLGEPRENMTEQWTG